MPETIIPPLPAVPSSADAPTRKWMGAVKEMLEVWAARRGDLLDQVVTYRDLLAVDMVNVSSRYPRLDSSGMTVGAVTTDVTIPPVVTGIVATGGYRNIFIEWDATTYNNRAYSEVLRSSVDVVGDAVVIGQTTGTIYVDAVGNSATYFYWVRSVSRSGIAGQMQTNGVSATSAVDVEYMLDVLTGEITESQLYVDLNSRIDLIDGPSIDPGTVNFRVLDLENRERRERVAQVDSNAEAALRAVLAVHDARLDAANTVAIAERALRQDIVDGVSAEASERLTLAAKVDTDIGTTVALIVDEATARADGDTAEATARELLRTTLESADADVIALVSTEAAARVSGDEAEAYQRTLLQASLEADDDVLTARIYTEETTRATADTALAQSITLLSAGAGEQFDWQTIWYFDAGIESWDGNGTPTASNGFLRAANQASSAYVTSPTGMATDAAKYGQMRLRVRKTGTVTFAGWLWWREAADSTWDTGRRIALVEPTWDVNDIGLITVTPEWTGTIDRIRIDLSDAQTVTDYMELDWVAVGRPSPGASSAQLLTEQTARIAGDTAIAEDVTELHAQVNHVTTGLPAAHAAVVTEASARASADSALTTSFNTLNAQVNHATTGLPAAFAAVEDEATARASAIDAEAATRELLAARVTDAESNITTNAASIVTEQTARADEDTALANSITALQAVVTDAESDIVQTQADLQSEQTVRATADDANATDVRRLRAKSEDADETALRNLLIGEGARGQFIGAIAVAQQELTSDIVAGLSAEAAARLDLQAAVNDNAAYVVDNIYTKTDTDSAIAGQITEFQTNTLEADYTNTAELVLNYYTKTDADGAIASSATTLRAYADTAAETAAEDAVSTFATDVYAGDIADIQGQIDQKVESFFTDTDPSTGWLEADYGKHIHDTWFKLTLKELYRWSGTAWVRVLDQEVIDAANAASGAQSTADGKIVTFAQTTAPTASATGDLWIDTDNDNAMYRWSGSAWVLVRDTSQAGAFAAWLTTTYEEDISDLEDGKIESFFTDNDPSVSWLGTDLSHAGDIWYDTDFKRLKRWSGTAWTNIEDQDALDAADAASNAQETADGKITTYTNAGIPTATVPTTTAALGDLCFDTNDGNKLYRWGGLSWAPVRDESIADVDARITTVETTKIGYCTLAGAASDHTTSTTCESAGGTWHVGLPLATAVKQVSVSDGVQTASLETVMQAHKTTLGNLESEYIVKIDNAGIMSGFGLYSGLSGSKFIANVDQFAVMTPISGVTARANSTAYAAGVTVKVGSVTARLLVCKSAGTSGSTAPTLSDSTTIGSLITDGTVTWQVASSVPFVVQTTGATVNGVTVPAGIYMDAAYIINATITGAQIGAEAVDNSHIANLSVEKLTSGSIEVGSYIESTNFLSGSQGWRIHGDGTAELSEAIVRGTVYATDGEFSGVVTTDGVTTKTVMDGGNVTTYLKVGSDEIPYQSLNHVESGVATNNTQVTIPGYFKNTPKVLVSPFDLSVYKAANSAQDQKLVCAVTNLIQDPAGSYIWKFTPTATLSLTAATSSVTVNTAASDGDLNDAWTSATYTTAANTTAISVSSTMTSVKTTGVSNTYYYRSITATLYYRVAGSGGSWLTGATSTLAMGASIANTLYPTLTQSSLSAASYEFYIGYSAFNTDGTSFTSGTPVYDYATTTSNTVYSNFLEGGAVNVLQTLTVPLTASIPSGYTVYSTTYTANVEARYTTGAGNWCKVRTTNYDVDGTYAATTGTWDANHFILYCQRDSVLSSVQIRIYNASATIYSRKLQTSTAYSNSSYLTSYTATLSASSSLATGTLNWIAIGA